MHQDLKSLMQYFNINKFGIPDEDREDLELFVLRGIPSEVRRKYWLTVTGAYGYLKNYSKGYY